VTSDSPPDDESRSLRRKGTVAFVLASVTLPLGVLAIAFGERQAIVYVVVSIVMFWQAWVLRSPTSALRKRIATYWIPLALFAGAALALAGFGLVQVRHDNNDRALFAFGGATLNASIAAAIAWRDRASRARDVHKRFAPGDRL
jgi:hypothetical protein